MAYCCHCIPTMVKCPNRPLRHLGKVAAGGMECHGSSGFSYGAMRPCGFEKQFEVKQGRFEVMVRHEIPPQD